MTAEECETVIQMDEATERASVWTAQKAVAAGLFRRGVKPEQITKDGKSGKPVSWLFLVPKSWVTVRPPRKGRTPSPEAIARLLSCRKTVTHKASEEKTGLLEGAQ